MSENKTDGAGSGIEALLAVMTRLRDRRTGCPWDTAQTFETIAPYTIEEAYEVADAIERDEFGALRDELGDLLFQVVFHAEMASERGAFDFHDVARTITEKMHRRHPHVFGADKKADPDTLNRAWEQHKADERAAEAATGAHIGAQPPSALDGVALALPALMRAQKLQRRAARVGFDWPDLAPVLGKIDEELAEIREALTEGAAPEAVAEEIGDLLFACVNVARHLGVDAEVALRGCNAKFTRRFNHIESRLAEQHRTTEDASLEEMEDYWVEAKRT